MNVKISQANFKGQYWRRFRDIFKDLVLAVNALYRRPAVLHGCRPCEHFTLI